MYFLPYLMGRRSPHNDSNARGTFVGMTMDTTRADLTQAVLEGPALGGAMLAAVADGAFESVEDAAEKIVRIVESIEPEPLLVKKYEERYQQFKEIYQK